MSITRTSNLNLTRAATFAIRNNSITSTIIRRRVITGMSFLSKKELLSPFQIYNPTFGKGRFFSTQGRILNQNELPNKPRITKKQLLAQASGPFSRTMVHLKWPLLRDNRPHVSDAFSAVVSWFVMGNILWIVLGTTTFGLGIMYSIHAYDNVLKKISEYFKGNLEENESENETKNKTETGILAKLTSSILSYGLGFKIEFEKGSILPELVDGMLKFKRFKIFNENLNEEDSFTFSAKVEYMNVSLSFNKWYEGNGLIKELEIYGLNGKMYKNEENITITEELDDGRSLPLSFNRYNENNHIQYDMHDHYSEELQNIKENQSRKVPFMDADYQIEHFKIHDSYMEIFNSKSEKPMRITIFNCDIPKLYGNRVLLDFFNANNVTGAINDSMFTIHKHQEYNSILRDEKRVIRFKLDGINFGSLLHDTLKFNWIVDGKAKIIADIRLPNLEEDNQDSNFASEYKKIGNFCSGLFKEVLKITTSTGIYESADKDTNKSHLLSDAIAAIYDTFTRSDANISSKTFETLSEYVIVNAKIKFYNLKASIPNQLPCATSTLTPFISLHDLRSLITFINNYDFENNPPITINTTVIEKLSDLYNIQNLSETKLFDLIVSDVYEDFLKMVKMDEKRIIHEKSNMWSHSVASQLLLLGLGVIV